MNMIHPTHYTVPKALINNAVEYYHNLETFKTPINEPTGNFFYDPWVIKKEYVGTVWENILNTLSVKHGEARIIILNYGRCYQSHSDIDDRYHLNLQGNHSFLIDIDNKKMFNTELDYTWYTMDTGRLHTAANFGEVNRVQLVVRHLLNKNNLTNPASIELICVDEHLARYHFDNTISSWLNKNNKLGTISNFSHCNNVVKFEIERNLLDELKNLLPKQFILKMAK